MKNTLKLDHENGLIVMDRTFAKKAENTMSTEYAHLQNVRRDYPTYQVIRREIKKNPNTEHYKGLTYQYMRDYIILHTSPEKEAEAVAEFDEQLLISRCHSKARRYPAIKKWFLEKYPEVALFGMPVIKKEEENSSAANSEKVVNMPIQNSEQDDLDPVSGF